MSEAGGWGGYFPAVPLLLGAQAENHGTRSGLSARVVAGQWPPVRAMGIEGWCVCRASRLVAWRERDVACTLALMEGWAAGGR